MKTNLIIATIAAAAFASTAVATPMRHHSHATSSETAATRALNQKSLEQASAGSTMTPRTGAMSDSGAAAPAAPMTPDAAPMASPSNAVAPAANGEAMAPTTPAPPQ